MYVCVPHFYDLSGLVDCWSSVSIRRIIYKFLNVCPFYYTAVAVSGKVERALTVLTTPIAGMLSATSAIDRPKSVLQLPYNRKCFFIFNIYIFKIFRILSYFNKTRLHKSVSFD